MLNKSVIHHTNKSLYNYNENTLLNLFNTQVKLRPNHIAVKFGQTSLTYEEFNERTDKVALGLLKLGVRADTMVAILLPRSLEMIISIFGILKAGGAYIPLGPKDGTERVNYILNDSNAPVLITQEKYLHFKADITVLGINLKKDDWFTAIKTKPQESLDAPIQFPVEIDPSSLAYVIYTSGTTGKPKGAMIEHQNLFAYLTNFRPSIDENDRTLQSMSTTCDSSVAEIFPTLCNGGTLIFWEKDLSSTIKKEKITYTNLTPSMADLIRSDDCSSLKKLIIGGEQLRPEILKRIPSHVSIYNGYGPTEATVDATVTKMDDSSMVHIGDPLPHVKLYVVNNNGQICQNDEAGELWIGGKGVARGYLNRPELTNEKFIKNPFGKGRIYKTGDKVCWKGKNLDFLGRIDRQVKVRGFRVELDGLEKLISSFDGVSMAHVVLTGENLTAYLTPKNLDLKKIKEKLSQQVPAFAVPSSFIDLDSFPTNSAGKVDEKSLPKAKLISVNQQDLPKTPDEKKLAIIWNKVLSSEKQIATTSNFFDLGGNSLNILKLTQILQEEFSSQFSLDQAYANPKFLEMLNILIECPTIEEIQEERASSWKILFDLIKFLPSYTYDTWLHHGGLIVLLGLFLLFPIQTIVFIALEFFYYRYFDLPHISAIRKIIIFISAPCKKYKSVEIIEEVPVEKIGRTAFMITPHGATEHHIRLVEELLLKKGIQYKNTHHYTYFNHPLDKTWYRLNMGIPGVEKSYHEVEKKNLSLIVALGDVEGLRMSEPGIVDQASQKVFFKYALQTGTSLTPIYVHGNDKAFTEFNHFSKLKFHIYKKYNGVIVQPYWGRWFLPIPHKVDLKITFGKPIKVDKLENPTWDQVENLYSRYIENLSELYRKHAPVDLPELKVY